MDTETLQRMDEQADRIIGHWSFAALGANILPPPFDMFAVGTVFASMGGHIARIYGVQMSRSVLRDLGVAIAKGMGGVLTAFYVGTGLLKYVPGVNVWVALLVQPPVVGAIAYAAGHAFKQYYHAVVIEGRALTAAQVGALATQALREKLKFLSESGYQMHEGSRQLELKEPIEKRHYSERRVILLADKFSTKDYFRLARQPSSLCFVSRDQTENVDWPAGHPVSDTLYVGHPLKPAKYYLATEFHNRLFEDKVVEFSKMLRHLGAKNTKIEHIEGYRHGGEIGAKLHASGTAGLPAFTKDVSATGSYSSGSNLISNV